MAKAKVIKTRNKNSIKKNSIKKSKTNTSNIKVEAYKGPMAHNSLESMMMTHSVTSLPFVPIDIHKAIRDGNLTDIKKAIKNKQNLNQQEKINVFMPENKNDIDAMDKYYSNYKTDPTKIVAYIPLTLAILHYCDKIALELIKAGVKLDKKPNCPEQYNPDSLTPLAAAIQTGNHKILRALLKAGAKVDKTSWLYGRTFDFDNHIKYTPLMIAIEKKDRKAVKMLLDAGANPEWNNNGDYCVRDIASCSYHNDKYIFTKLLGFTL